MRHQYNFISVLLAGSLLAACSSEGDEPGTPPGGPRPAAFSAQIGKTASRAAGTQWAAGDAIGISGVSGAKTYANVPFATASGDGNFTPTGDDIFYNDAADVTFTAYYPYAADLGADGIITASVVDQTNQSVFNFMWAQAVGSYATPDVRFTFAHRMSRLALTFTNGNDVDLSAMSYTIDGLILDGSFDTATGEAKALDGAAATALPIAAMAQSSQTQSTSSLIVFPQTASNLVINATIAGQTYQTDLSIGELKSGANYRINITVTKTAMTVTGCTISSWGNGGEIEGEVNPVIPIGDKNVDEAAIGDFYMNDGSLIDKDATLTDEQLAACIGIVFTTDVNRIGEGAKAALAAKGVTPHGLVMALTDAVERTKWGENRDEEGIVNNTVVNAMYTLVDGYADTQWIINSYASKLEDKYSAFYHAARYGETEETKQYASPANTTGWFLPSAGNWWDILRNLGKVEQLDDWIDSEENWFDIKNVGTSIISNLNSCIGQIEKAPRFTEDHFDYWTSTEVAASVARFITIYPNPDSRFEISNYLKGNTFNSVRCVLAF